MKNVVDEFSKYIKDTTYIIGIDFIGMLLASRIAVKNKLKFSYIISGNNINGVGKFENKVIINSEEKIILCTDVLITGHTVNSCIEQLNKCYGITKNQVINIFTVFLREPYECDENRIVDSFQDKMIVLNKEFDVEICNKDNCIFREKDIFHCENRHI